MLPCVLPRYVIVVEHDLSVLDYLSDFICCLYGVPGAYGVVTLPIGVREGINIFLDGYIPAENLRFRETSLVFKVSEQADKVEIYSMSVLITQVSLLLVLLISAAFSEPSVFLTGKALNELAFFFFFHFFFFSLKKFF